MKSIFLTVTNDLTFDQRMIRICTSLSNAGFRVTLIGRLRPNSKSLAKAPFQQHRLQCFFDSGKLFYLEYNLRLLFFLIGKKYDALCAIDLDTILPVYFCSRIKRVPCVYDAHEYFTELPEVIERPMVKWVWSKVASLCIPRIKHAYTVCESLAQIFEQQYGTTFQVIRNVPFAQETTATPTENPQIILYQGALNDGRGLEQVIAAMDKVGGAELWLAGEGDLSQMLRAQVKKLGLEKKVQFLGYLRPNDLKKVTLKAHIGLNLLQNKGLNYYYSLANKAFDYIQAGLPSVHMNFPEYQRINAEQEVFSLIDDLEINTIVQALQQLLNDRQLYQKLRNNCLEAKARYTWEKEEKKLIQIYQNLG